MRIRKVRTNCSNEISFEEFEEEILNKQSVIFTPDYERFAIHDVIKGDFLEEFDVFWESEEERVRFLEWMKELDY